ncbi:MAG: hypothetical protein KF889_14635 [Alphaproteobacteria bacterium]|nr:hypothetical protein [Alphaproteobacteria bacterium]MCW5738764.1 hypothetical protein [Alphaproteobacteria bacterium]
MSTSALLKRVEAMRIEGVWLGAAFEALDPKLLDRPGAVERRVVSGVSTTDVNVEDRKSEVLPGAEVSMTLKFDSDRGRESVSLIILAYSVLSRSQVEQFAKYVNDRIGVPTRHIAQTYGAYPDVLEFRSVWEPESPGAASSLELPYRWIVSLEVTPMDGELGALNPRSVLFLTVRYPIEKR